MCFPTIFLAFLLLVTTFVVAALAKLISKLYQKNIMGYIDEELTALWQSRAALVSVLGSLLVMILHVRNSMSD